MLNVRLNALCNTNFRHSSSTMLSFLCSAASDELASASLHACACFVHNYSPDTVDSALQLVLVAVCVPLLLFVSGLQALPCLLSNSVACGRALLLPPVSLLHTAVAAWHNGTA